MSARKLWLSKSKGESPNALQMLTPRRSLRLNQPISPPLSPPENNPPLTSPDNNPPRTQDDNSLNNLLVSTNLQSSLWNASEVSPILPKSGTGRGRGMRATRGIGRGAGRGRSNGRGRGNVPETIIISHEDFYHSQTHLAATEASQEVAAPLNFPKPSNVLKKKLPITTQKRKGLFVSKKQVTPTNSKDKETVFRKINLAISLSDNAELENMVDFEEDAYDDDYDSDEDSDDDSGSDVSLIDENVDSEDEYMPMVQDNFDPYEYEAWERSRVDLDAAENYIDRLYANGEVYKNEEFGRIMLKPWQLFIDKAHFKDTLRDYCIQCGFSVIVDKANNSRYTAQCAAENCAWRLHASRLPDGVTWAIKSIKNSEHTCNGLETSNSMVTAKWAARVLLEDIRANNDIPAKSLNELLWQRYRIQMKKSRLYRMRSATLIDIHGGFDVSYSHLPKYCEMIRVTNPRSTAICGWLPAIHPEKPLAFVCIFVAFKGALDGLFAGCRSLIGVDGCHLKGNYGGILLSAVGMDGNNEIFPFAWAIVAAENKESWKFFVYHLKNILKEGGRGDEWCFISDRQKGIDAALSELWPAAGIRYCCKHLVTNWQQTFKGPLMYSLFWKAACATSPFTFKKAMEAIQKTNPAALIWLSKLGDQERWTKHLFDPRVKNDINKTNFVESFNATLGIDRCRPVLTLLEGIRRVTMVRLVTRRQICEGWSRGDICPNIIKRVHKMCQESRCCKALLSQDGEFEVLDGKSTLNVSLNSYTCKCGLWQISGIPCRHGMRAILASGLDPLKFVDDWYSVRRYKLAYAHGISSIPDTEQWPELDFPSIQPPKITRGVGRPSRNRKRGDDEEAKGKRCKTVQCSKCKTFGHNALTCKGGYTNKQKKAATKNKSSTQASTSMAKPPSSSQAIAKRIRSTANVAVSQPVPMRKNSASVFSPSQP